MDALGWTATAATLGFFAANALQSVRIIRAKSVGDLSFYQFGAAYLKYDRSSAELNSIVACCGSNMACPSPTRR